MAVFAEIDATINDLVLRKEHISCAVADKFQGDRLDIVFGVNAAYVPPMGIMIYSILAHNRELNIRFHVLTSSIEDDDLGRLKSLFAKQERAAIDIYCLNEEKVKNFIGDKAVIGDDPAFFFIPIAARILSSTVKKMLYIDADMLCVGNLSGLLNVEMGEAAFLAVYDNLPPKQLIGHRRDLGLPQGAPYFNSGTLYVDLERWQALDISAKFIKVMEEVKSGVRRLWFQDQDALNIAAQGMWRELSVMYNLQAPVIREKYKGKIPPEAVIIHYAACYKPWVKWEESDFDDIIKEHCPEITLYRKYRQNSPWPDFRRGEVNSHDVRLLSKAMLLQGHYLTGINLQKRYLQMKLGKK